MLRIKQDNDTPFLMLSIGLASFTTPDRRFCTTWTYIISRGCLLLPRWSVYRICIEESRSMDPILSDVPRRFQSGNKNQSAEGAWAVLLWWVMRQRNGPASGWSVHGLMYMLPLPTQQRNRVRGRMTFWRPRLEGLYCRRKRKDRRTEIVTGAKCTPSLSVYLKTGGRYDDECLG